jgi:hypothetical protein
MGALRKNQKKIDWGGSEMQGVKFYSIYLTEESPVGRENLIW